MVAANARAAAGSRKSPIERSPRKLMPHQITVQHSNSQRHFRPAVAPTAMPTAATARTANSFQPPGFTASNPALPVEQVVTGLLLEPEHVSVAYIGTSSRTTTLNRPATPLTTPRSSPRRWGRPAPTAPTLTLFTITASWPSLGLTR
jgi:hypothetical protein